MVMVIKKKGPRCPGEMVHAEFRNFYDTQYSEASDMYETDTITKKEHRRCSS